MAMLPTSSTLLLSINLAISLTRPSLVIGSLAPFVLDPLRDLIDERIQMLRAEAAMRRALTFLPLAVIGIDGVDRETASLLEQRRRAIWKAAGEAFGSWAAGRKLAWTWAVQVAVRIYLLVISQDQGRDDFGFMGDGNS